MFKVWKQMKVLDFDIEKKEAKDFEPFLFFSCQTYPFLNYFFYYDYI